MNNSPLRIIPGIGELAGREVIGARPEDIADVQRMLDVAMDNLGPMPAELEEPQNSQPDWHQRAA